MFDQGQVAIITGAGPGMGRAIAVGFAEQGVDVVLSSRRIERLEAIAADVRGAGREPLVVPADLSRAEDCRRVVDETVARFGRVDHLVQNGHHDGDWKTALEGDDAEWHQIFEVNFFGALNLMKAAVPHMRATGHGNVVLINSGAALKSPPTMGAYAASKAALASLVRTTAQELGPDIRVNGIFLGAVTGENTDRYSAPLAEAEGITLEEYLQNKGRTMPIGEIPTPEQCAGSVLFFCSKLADAVTGQHLSVNGGQWVT